MQAIDPHIHMYAIKKADLESMALAGISTVIADAGPLPAYSAQGVLEFYQRTLTYDVPRGAEFFINVYVTIGINMLWIPPDWEKIIEQFPKYLKEDKVVGIGEIGIDTRSPSCPSLDKQDEVLRTQLKLVKEYDVPLRLHLPPTDKTAWADKYFRQIDEFGLNREKTIISHVDSSVLKTIIESGCIAEITISPWRKLGPEDAAKMLKGAALDRVMVDSDSALRTASDVLSVPKVALEMRKLGFSAADIQKVVYDNPRRIFDLA
jgi:predicted metal-dependent TIM-barrel fold hydrolase